MFSSFKISQVMQKMRIYFEFFKFSIFSLALILAIGLKLGLWCQFRFIWVSWILLASCFIGLLDLAIYCFLACANNQMQNASDYNTERASKQGTQEHILKAWSRTHTRDGRRLPNDRIISLAALDSSTGRVVCAMLGSKMHPVYHFLMAVAPNFA